MDKFFVKLIEYGDKEILTNLRRNLQKGIKRHPHSYYNQQDLKIIEEINKKIGE